MFEVICYITIDNYNTSLSHGKMTAVPLGPHVHAPDHKKIVKSKGQIHFFLTWVTSFLSGTQTLSKNPQSRLWFMYYWSEITPHGPLLVRRWLERGNLDEVCISQLSVSAMVTISKPHRVKDLFLNTCTSQVAFWGDFQKKDLVKWNFQKPQGQDCRAWVPYSSPTPFSSRENWGFIFLCYFYSSISLH